MKKLLTTLLLFIAITNLSAEISVKSFRKLENDLDARVNAPIKDFNGDISAIIKVVTTQTGFTFDCGQAGIVKTVNKPSEIWVYVPYGVKRITIMHPQLGQLRDWIFTQPIEKATVYEMVITTGKVITTVEETIESQWLVITPEPNDATVYLDEVFVKSGMYQAKLKPGSYTYRIEAPLYHTEAGKVEITDAKKEITAKLKPAFGYVSVTTSPEKDAKVIIDGKTLTTNTPCKSEALASGEHTVQVIKEMYQPTAQKVTVTDGQTTPINFTMQPNFAEVTITAPTNAALYVNNEKKATGNWNGRLNAGVYSLEARLDKHRTAKQDIEVTAGDKKTIDLQPTPIYGSLDVVTTPAGANITINGKEYGTTPNTVSKLLIGEYTVELRKEGYAKLKKMVQVTDGKSTELLEKLETGKVVTINSIPTGAILFIDEINSGTTPYNGRLNFGNHALRIENKGNIANKDINITQNENETSYTISMGRMVTINSSPTGATLFIDGNAVGATPYSGNLIYGNHSLRTEYNGKKSEKIVSISEESDETSFTIKTSFAIGDAYLGGKIAYIDASGIHGFVCAPPDQVKSMSWYNGEYIAANTGRYKELEQYGVYGRSKSIGHKNTDEIIAKQGAGRYAHSYAAYYCASLTIGNATPGDWYLPSDDELLETVKTNGRALGFYYPGSYPEDSYWSSTEGGRGEREAYSCSSTGCYQPNKDSIQCVVAIRAF